MCRMNFYLRSLSHKNTTYIGHVRFFFFFFFYASRPGALARRKFRPLGNSVPAICHVARSLVHLPPIYGPWRSIMPILGSFCLPDFFFPTLASTIHPRALIEARTAGAEYREGWGREKNLVDSPVVGRRSLHALHDRYAVAVSWRGAIGRSVGGAKSGNEGKEMRHMDGRTDGQTGTDRKWNVLGGELNDVFEFGRQHPSDYLNERDEREPSPPFGRAGRRTRV